MLQANNRDRPDVLGSSKPWNCGAEMFLMVVVVSILTTPGATFLTKGAKLCNSCYNTTCWGLTGARPIQD